MEQKEFVGRAGEKLVYALKRFGVSVEGETCADFGSAVGGFVDCLLRNGARRVYAVEKGYGVLDWNLRHDSRVVVMERTNAMYVDLPEKVSLVTIDVGWTRQENIIPNALKQLKEGGVIISLIKPQYEAEKRFLRGGKLMESEVRTVVNRTLEKLVPLGTVVKGLIRSPILGEKGGNIEYLVYLVPG